MKFIEDKEETTYVVEYDAGWGIESTHCWSLNEAMKLWQIQYNEGKAMMPIIKEEVTYLDPVLDETT